MLLSIDMSILVAFYAGHSLRWNYSDPYLTMIWFQSLLFSISTILSYFLYSHPIVIFLSVILSRIMLYSSSGCPILFYRRFSLISIRLRFFLIILYSILGWFFYPFKLSFPSIFSTTLKFQRYIFITFNVISLTMYTTHVSLI